MDFVDSIWSFHFVKLFDSSKIYVTFFNYQIVIVWLLLHASIPYRCFTCNSINTPTKIIGPIKQSK